MPYKQKIKTLEESYRTIDNEIFFMQKSGRLDNDKLQELYNKRNQVLDELRQLRKLQYDHDHDRFEIDDDR